MKIFHIIKAFFAHSGARFSKGRKVMAYDNECGNNQPTGVLQGSQKHLMSCWRVLKWIALNVAAGTLAAAAFPPLNWTWAVLAAPAILFLAVRNCSAWTAAAGGWLWGMGYALCSFFWLREINPAIPWLMMLVLGAYYIPVGWTAAVAYRYILLPSSVRAQGFTAQCSFREFSLWRQLAWCVCTAGSLVLVEYLRHSVLPWNYLGVAFYRNAVIMQLARWTGVSGLTLLSGLVSSALALAVLTVAQKDPQRQMMRYRRPWPLLLVLGVLALVMVHGVISLRQRRQEYAAFAKEVQMTLVQGNLSQRRFGGEASGLEALNTYSRLTRTQQGVPTDLVVWPETAVNYPLRGASTVSALYRDEVRELSRLMRAPMLLGTLEFDMSTRPPGSLNSAVLTGTQDVLRYGYWGMYSKVHPVPFGEFVPMRRYLPEWVIKLIDMQRDLTPGKSLAPLKLNEDIRLGMNICFEDVFAYIAREELRCGANMLLVISNDAWYPTSSEPEQHLANAVARAIETNLPMVRCGNDSATCLITPGGEIIWSLAEALKFADGQPFRRGAGAATITVKVPDSSQIQPTFYSRHGDWLVGAVGIIYAVMLLIIFRQCWEFTRKGLV